MAKYLFVFNGGSPRERTENHLLQNDDAAIKSARARVGAIDQSIGVGRGANAVEAEWLGAWDYASGKPVWTPDVDE